MMSNAKNPKNYTVSINHMFTLHKKDNLTKARRGEVQTDHGVIQSPFFMPVGTNGTVKSLTFEDLREVGAQIMLSNTYHLNLRPGMDIIRNNGGLHGLSGWDKPLLTDSGGYQIFSLAKLRKLTDEGVEFQSHLDGSPVYLDPETVVDIQRDFGVDMMMPLDECAPYPCSYDAAQEAVERTTRWAKRAREHFLKTKRSDLNQYQFGIIQGSIYRDLRERSAREITDVGFDAYAVGGVSVGETVKEMFEALQWTEPLMPENKPRYFMGIGFPDQIVKAVGEGIDMFDCVLPSRYGRHGTAFTHKGRVTIKNADCADDSSPVDEKCACVVCQKYSRAYIRHLLKAGEITGLKLLTYHNVYFYLNLMKQMRDAIEEDRFKEFHDQFLREYKSELSE